MVIKMPYDILMVSKTDFLEILNSITEKVKSFRFIESSRVVVESESLTGFVVDRETSLNMIQVLVWVHPSDLEKYNQAITGNELNIIWNRSKWG